jgi:iron-sulfur cluster assembly protein
MSLCSTFVKNVYMEAVISNPVHFTASASAEVIRLLGEADFDQQKKLRVGVKGGGCSGMTYILEFDEVKANDQLFETADFSFIMDKSHGIYLLGMEVNWEGGLNSRGFTFKNPNASSTCGCGTSFAV